MSEDKSDDILGMMIVSAAEAINDSKRSRLDGDSELADKLLDSALTHLMMMQVFVMEGGPDEDEPTHLSEPRLGDRQNIDCFALAGTVRPF